MTDSNQKIEETLKNYEQEQKEFENHWLWQKLKTTPEEFFKRVNENVKKSGIDNKVWQEKLSEAKRVLETRIAEKNKTYQSVDYKNYNFMKA